MADVASLLQESKNHLENKCLRSALKVLNKAKELDSENKEVNHLIGSCHFDLKSVEDHYNEGMEAVQTKDKVQDYQSYIEMSKLIAKKDMNDKERIFAQEVAERERLRALQHAAEFLVSNQYVQAKEIMDEYSAKAGHDVEIESFLELVKDAPAQAAKRHRRSMIGKILLPSVVIIVVAIVYFMQMKKEVVDTELQKKEKILFYLGDAFVNIPAGSFMMGADAKESEAADERPVHNVKIESFDISIAEIPQALWEMVIGGNPSFSRVSENPVETVTWMDVQKFIYHLNEIDPDKGYRLPTEAQWEYAYRAGTTTRYYNGETEADLEDIAWYNGREDEKAFPIKRQTPNA